MAVCLCSSTNHYCEHVIDRSELPHYLIKSAAGDYLLQQTQPKVHSPTLLFSGTVVGLLLVVVVVVVPIC